jgi:mannose-6-phosphate isomerase-like protein (cupin superfamily)
VTLTHSSQEPIDTFPLHVDNSVRTGRRYDETMRGYVTAESVVAARREASDTAEVRVAIDASCGCERLEQRVIRFAQGRSAERDAGARQEVLYVAAGEGTLDLGGARHPLEPGTGVFVRPGDRYAVENPGPDELVVVSVTAPCEGTDSRANGRGVTVRYEDRPALPASPNREFRYLVNQDLGCKDVTQFVGLIPPGKAGLHSHTYDEVVYVLEGEGVLHLGERDTPIAAGSCIHLPPLEEHCLENTGAGTLRVLGVFHPSGDPASRATEEPNT